MAQVLSLKLALIPPEVKLEDKDKKKRAAQRLAANKALFTATERLAKFLPAALGNTLEKYQWPWGPAGPGNAGKGSPRVINDTGYLRSTLTIKTSYVQSKGKISINYSAPYAALVYYGGAIHPYGNRNAATVLLPGRPWIEKTLTDKDTGFLGETAQEDVFNVFRLEFYKNMRLQGRPQ